MLHGCSHGGLAKNKGDIIVHVCGLYDIVCVVSLVRKIGSFYLPCLFKVSGGILADMKFGCHFYVDLGVS
jgi:hypothetical protein